MKKSKEYKNPGDPAADVEAAKMVYWPPGYVPKKSTEQAASMEATLARDPSQDEVHWNRELDLSKAKAEHIDCEARLASYGFDQISHLENIRRRSKNTQGTTGVESATTPESRNRAIEGFYFSPGIQAKDLAPEDLERLKSMPGYQTREPITETKDKSWFAKCMDYLDSLKQEHKNYSVDEMMRIVGSKKDE